MKRLATGLAALAMLISPSLAVTPAQAAQEITIKFCTYSAESPRRQYTSVWKVRATALWYCQDEGDGAGYKRVGVRLQQWNTQFSQWINVTSDSLSGTSTWPTPVTQISVGKCAKGKFRTAAFALETDSTGHTNKTFQTVYSPSLTVTGC